MVCGTILDPAPFTEIPDSFLKLIDILVPNNIELHQMSGLDDMEKAASSIIQRGVKTVVVTAGADGAILFERGSISRIKGPAVSTVDTTGAGDSFAGAMAVALSEGKSTLEAVEFANCAGALACTVLGAQPSLPSGKMWKGSIVRLTGPEYFIYGSNPYLRGSAHPLYDISQEYSLFL